MGRAARYRDVLTRYPNSVLAEGVGGAHEHVCFRGCAWRWRRQGCRIVQLRLLPAGCSMDAELESRCRLVLGCKAVNHRVERTACTSYFTWCERLANPGEGLERVGEGGGWDGGGIASIAAATATARGARASTSPGRTLTNLLLCVMAAQRGRASAPLRGSPLTQVHGAAAQRVPVHARHEAVAGDRAVGAAGEQQRPVSVGAGRWARVRVTANELSS